MEYSMKISNEFLENHNSIYVEHAFIDHSAELQLCSSMLLVYVAHGYGIFKTSKAETETEEGDVFLINKNIKSRFYSTAPKYPMSVYYCAFFEAALTYTLSQIRNDFPELSSFFDGKQEFLCIHDTEHLALCPAITRILDDFIYSQPAYKYSAKSSLSSMLITIFRTYTTTGNLKDTFDSSRLIGIINKFVKKNLRSKITINEIANIMHITPQHFCHVFKKHTGVTFSDYVNRLRVAKIREHLENTDRPIHIIYKEYDFSPQYINRMFKRYTGYSLQEYKKKFNYKVNNPLYKI